MPSADMSRSFTRKVLCSPAVLASIFTLAAAALGWLTPLEQQSLDARATLTRHTVTSDLVLIEIDARSLQQLQRWPWPRHYHAQLLNQLHAAGAGRIFYDVDFSAASNPEDDAQLAAALARFTTQPVMLPAFVQPDTSLSPSALVTSLPLAAFRQHSDLALVNLRPDSDGRVRRIAGSTSVQGKQAVLAGIHLSEQIRHPEAYLEKDILIDYSIDPASFTRLSFVDVMQGRFDHTQVQGRPVVIGATAIELGDMLPVPVYRSLPGIVVQGLAYQTLMQGGLQIAPIGYTVTALLLLLLMMTWVFNRAGWRSGLTFTVCLLALTGGLATYAYARFDLITPLAPLFSLLIIGYALLLISRIEQQHLRLLLQALDLRRKDRLMANVVNNSSDAILTISSEELITSVNPAAQRLLHSSAEQLIGAAVNTLLDILPVNSSSKQLLPSLMHEHGHTLECQVRRTDGTLLPVEISISYMEIDNEQLYTLFMRDISERLRQRRILEHQATHDALTGLRNRFYLNRTLEQRLLDNDINAASLALLLIDLDKFKEINDTLGHGVGDAMLQQVAARFTQCLTEDMILTRIGGDEFAIIIDRPVDEQQCRAVANDLLLSMDKPFAVQDVNLEIRASIGIALYPQHATSPVELLQKADTAMYVAKRACLGVSFYHAEFAKQTAMRMTISTGLRAAIAENQLTMFYQPKVDLDSNTVIGAEALLRWNHPQLGLIGPEEVVEVAESTGMIWLLTEWTLKSALHDAALWRAQGFPLRIAVNLSARLLQDQTLVSKITACLDQCATDPQYLALEITESAIMDDPDTALKNALALDKAGIYLSIDDFGTGYSSLSYLRNLPARELKIDKSFVLEMLNNDSDALIVRSTIELAHNLGLKVVAEGIETQEVLNTLRKLGCDTGQGYFLSRPVTFDNLCNWLRDYPGQHHPYLAAQNR